MMVAPYTIEMPPPQIQYVPVPVYRYSALTQTSLDAAFIEQARKTVILFSYDSVSEHVGIGFTAKHKTH